jgi:hypothetical protein
MQSGGRSPSPDGKSPKTDLSGNVVRRPNNGWTKEQEHLMAGWADVASCYRWMHDKCEKIMAKRNLLITVPVIILSTLTGSANFIMSSIIGDNKQMQTYAQIGIGGVSIFTGILTTLGNFFRYAQNSESHRVSGIAWGKFQRQLDVELKLHPKDRIDCMDFLKISRAELDRLIEQSPPIPDVVINAFVSEFKDLKDLKKPDIAHGMEHTKIFDDKDTRLKQLAADAAIFLQQKRKVWHKSLMPEVEHTIQRKITDLSGNLYSALQTRIEALEKELEEKNKPVSTQYKSFRRNSQIVFRGRPGAVIDMDSAPIHPLTANPLAAPRPTTPPRKPLQLTPIALSTPKAINLVGLTTPTNSVIGLGKSSSTQSLEKSTDKK